MVDGYDWAAIGRAILALGVIGVILHGATLWAFQRLAR